MNLQTGTWHFSCSLREQPASVEQISGAEVSPLLHTKVQGTMSHCPTVLLVWASALAVLQGLDARDELSPGPASTWLSGKSHEL